MAKNQSRTRSSIKDEQPAEEVDKMKNKEINEVQPKRKLRSTLSTNDIKDVDVEDLKSIAPKVQKMTKETNNKTQNDVPQNSINGQTTRGVGRPPKAKNVILKQDKQNKQDKQDKQEETPDKPSSRTTRQKSYPAVKKETRSTKPQDNTNQEVADTGEKQATKRGPKKTAKAIPEINLSSDDDRPLANTLDKRNRKMPATQLEERTQKNLKRNSTQRNGSRLSLENERDVSPHDKSEASSNKSEPLIKRKNITTGKQQKITNKRLSINKKCVTEDSSGVKSELDSQDEINKTGNKKLRKKRRNEFTDLSQTDHSENETKTGRPMRKTKEAAAIYMELIGQKLNFGEFDDDNYSMDSFPELPNVKKTEQMENELKANVGKEKRELTSTPRKNKTKKDGDSFLGPPPEEKPSKVSKVSSGDVITVENVVKAEKVTGKTSDKDKTQTNIEKPEQTIAVGESDKTKLEKSFSDSDDEPLATKIVKKVSSPKKKKKTVVESNKVTSPEVKKITPNSSDPIPKSNVNAKAQNASPEKPAPVLLNIPKVEQHKIILLNELSAKMKQTSPQNVDLSEVEFKMPAESVTQLLSPPINISPLRPTYSADIKSTSTPLRESTTPSSSAAVKNSTQNISTTLADLMPSKEESGKIFGIASVTLAQSSGPNDTKCTLGKCGSIHKPPLGPVVKTESYFGEQMTSKERRKAKVSMTHEQIEKWLTDCAMNTEGFETDSLDDDLDLNLSSLKPINYLSTPSPFRERELTENNGPSSSLKRLNRIKEKPLIVARGPSLKAKPIAIKDDRKDYNIDSLGITSIYNELLQQNKDRDLAASSVRKEIDNMKPVTTNPEQSKNNDLLKKEQTQRTPLIVPVVTPKPITKEPDQTGSSFKLINKPSPSTFSLTKPFSPTVSEKKPIYSRRTPVYNTKKVEPINLSKNSVINTFGAFSVENEASVYSFDKEEDTIPASIPFRRHSRRGSTHSRPEDVDKSLKKDTSTMVSNKTNEFKTPPKKQQFSLTLSPEDNNKSASIAVQVSDQMNKGNKTKDKVNPSDDAKDSDSEGHTFYIPLQCPTITGGSSDHIIQGVAVKLGTEGPEGPNQKVIMHAKLVTKSQMGPNTTPIPEGMANVHEIVKTLIANKDSGSKLVPIGTVQPRFKTNDINVASTSTSLVIPQPQIQQTETSVPRSTTNQAVPQKSKNTKRTKIEQTIQPTNNTAFPRYDDPAQMVEAPVFRPTEKEFQDPMDFIDRITPIAARFGMCRIIPPASFKPECRIFDDMRFTSYNQYVHKMLNRWGPSVKEFNAIKKYLATQSISLKQPPLIGGMEVDLPRLYHTVQELGGLKEVIEKKKWARVAEEMCIPKAAQDRVTKLDDIYCKYLLPYDTLSQTERQKLFDEVESDWAKIEAKARRNADPNEASDEEEESENEDAESEIECVFKGKNMALSGFFRIARNTMALWFKNTEPPSSEVEAEFWRHVAVRDSHVCVLTGSVDSSGWGYGFPAPGPKTKNSPCSKHPWNLKVLTNNHSSILRSIGPVTGVTSPTLHVGMLFTACCWYRDPHSLPWIEYLHTGGSKIWYSVPNEQSSQFRAAFTSLVPTHCKNKTVWLPCDTAMVPPHMLTDRGVSLCRTEQEPGQFVLVFPRAYTSNICTGYIVSESVYFASINWLDTAKQDFKDIRSSFEPAMFSFEQLLFSIASDLRSNLETLEKVLPMIEAVYCQEREEHEELKELGITRTDKHRQKSKRQVPENVECGYCRTNLYISWVHSSVAEDRDEYVLCLQCAIKQLRNGAIKAPHCILWYLYKINDIEEMIAKTNDRIAQQKKKIEAKK